METDWEDDWENNNIPDLLVSIQNKERELKLIEERKLMEDADLALAEELFNDEQEKKNESKKQELFVPVKPVNEKPVKEKPKGLQILQEQKRQELREKQKQQSQKQKEKKQKEKKHKELFGEAEIDEYEEMYGYIEDQY
jgi:hypothetical protein